MICEHTEKFRSGAICIHFYMKKNNQTESSFKSKHNTDGNNILYILLIHVLNYIDIFGANILAMGTWEVSDVPCAALRQMRLMYSSTVLRIQPLLPVKRSRIIMFGRWVRMPYSNLPYSSAFVLLKLTLGVSGSSLPKDSYIDHHHMLNVFTDTGYRSNLFCTPFLRNTFASLVLLKMLTTQQDYHGDLPES